MWTYWTHKGMPSAQHLWLYRCNIKDEPACTIGVGARERVRKVWVCGYVCTHILVCADIYKLFVYNHHHTAQLATEQHHHIQPPPPHSASSKTCSCAMYISKCLVGIGKTPLVQVAGGRAPWLLVTLSH